MKNCTDCKHALWRLTAAGRLHPSGDGLCKYEYKAPPIPACMYWMSATAPKPYGGTINRREELKDHCPTFARATAAPVASPEPAGVAPDGPNVEVSGAGTASA